MGVVVIWMSIGSLTDTRFDSHGGYGFQTSWGSASVAVELLEHALSRGSHVEGEFTSGSTV
jgi:hypothetical protein